MQKEAYWASAEWEGVTQMSDLIAVKVKGNVGTIEDNLDAVEISIREKTQEYMSVVVTEDTVKDGKKMLADIRKEKKALDDERKTIKSRWMAPYEAFEKRAKQIIALYDEPVKAISGQIESFEEQRRAEKRTMIEAIYNSVKGDLGEWLPLERIYNTKWENATCSEKKIREDMQMLFDQIQLSISTIQTMHSEFEYDALLALKKTGDLQIAVARINELQENRRRFTEQAEREAELKKKESEDVEKNTGPVQSAEEEEISDIGPFERERTLTVVVKIAENSFGLLKTFLDTAELEYEVM